MPLGHVMGGRNPDGGLTPPGGSLPGVIFDGQQCVPLGDNVHCSPPAVGGHLPLLSTGTAVARNPGTGGQMLPPSPWLPGGPPPLDW